MENTELLGIVKHVRTLLNICIYIIDTSGPFYKHGMTLIIA